MSVLKFTLLPSSIGHFYELLLCLAKFGETVSIEAQSDKLTVTALNLGKTAYAAFTLDASTFFLDYKFNTSALSSGSDRFTCQLLNKALQPVFKGRTNEGRSRESIVERCEVAIQDQPDLTECRIIIKMICKHGMAKTYRLTYEAVEVMHALFDRTSATQGWRISSRVLRDYIEYFGPKTEKLDLLAQEGKVIFTSFTEKIQDGKEVLKQPMETAISIHTEEFEDFHMHGNMHLVTSVNDFKAIVTHAETLRASVTARFSFPKRPLQFSYQNFGVHGEVTLTTSGDLENASQQTEPIFVSTRASSRQQSAPVPTNTREVSEMPPPARPSHSKPLASSVERPSLRSQVRQPAISDIDRESESLFVPEGDDDQRWDTAPYDQDDGELGWDANNEHPSASFHQTFRDSGTSVPAQSHSHEGSASQEGLEPTQRMSQLHGLFD